MASVDNSNNAGLYGYGAALAGGAAGGYLGAKKAPSVLGNIDVDKVLTHDLETDIARDRIYNKLGQAQGDFFVKSRKAWYDIEHAIPNDVNMMFGQVGEETELTVGQLKKAIEEGKIVSCKSNGVEQIENYKKALNGLADDTKLTKDSLSKLLRENHSAYKAAKKDILTILERAPKLTGKFALIGAAIGAATAGFLGLVAGKSAS